MVSEKVPVLAQAGTEPQELPPGRGEGGFQKQLLNPQLLCTGDQTKSKSALAERRSPDPLRAALLLGALPHAFHLRC